MKKSDPTTDFRFQGTDGIRREVKLSSSEGMDLTPQEVFLKLGFITEELMEIYAYAHVKQLKLAGKIRARDNIVIGWDPRDPRGNFTAAVVSGVCKAGANALILGVVPTPLVPMYMLYKNARGGFMVTASHNPKDQNGVKAFSSFKGLKPLPDNDVALTSAVLKVNPSTLRKLNLDGKRIDSRKEALNLFYTFSLAPENTWIPPGLENRLFKNITLVVDAANGSLSGIAEKVFRKVGFGKVIEVNSKLNGNVNLKSGVADLEGKTLITKAMTQRGTGIFSEHLAITKLLELGRKNRTSVAKGYQKICGAVFDADGDRFYRLEYDAFRDALIVMGGDEAAFFQAKHLITSDPKRYMGTRYINTVESDLNATAAAKKLGFRPMLTSVGDKWILLRIAILIVEKRLREMKKSTGGKVLPVNLLKKWKDIQNNDTLDVQKLERLESELNQFEKINKAGQRVAGSNESDFLSFAIGSEETGHSITEGFLTCENSKNISVFFGNGLKSAINTFTATQLLLGAKKTRSYFTALTKPFPPGYKQTFYTYYVKKKLFYKNSQIWNRLKTSIYHETRNKGFNPRFTSLSEEPDMLYIALTSKEGERAAIFIRNSGTENKIGIHLRGSIKNAAKLRSVGQKCVKILLSSMKDFESYLYKLEEGIFNQLSCGPIPNAKLKLKKPTGERVLSEMAKQGLIRLTKKGHTLTTLGKWYQSTKI